MWNVSQRNGTPSWAEMNMLYGHVNDAINIQIPHKRRIKTRKKVLHYFTNTQFNSEKDAVGVAGLREL